MTTSAIIMMIIAILVVWGGLALSAFLLSRSSHPGDVSVHRDL